MSVLRSRSRGEDSIIQAGQVELGETSLKEDTLVSLMDVYATQFASYTTLLWQVPVLGLTAQSFLLTIALAGNVDRTPRLIAAILSALIAAASYALMHDQRGRAINHAIVLRRFSNSRRLRIVDIVGELDSRDGKPTHATAAGVWDVDHMIYGVWRGLMILFAIAGVGVIIATLAHASWTT